MIVRVEGLTKRFAVRRSWREALVAPFARPRSLAVDGVSFTVAEREVFGLLGQNGAGKTTLFKLLATLIVADSGHAEVGGHDVTVDGREARALLAPVLANDRSLYWRLNATENLRLFAVLQGIRGAAILDEVRRVLAVTGLADTGEKLVAAFSSGMRQRLLIARALLGRPRVLLLDEPTRSLDPIAARDLRRFLREVIVAAEGCTVLLATHDADEVWDLCDRVGVLERGRLLAVEPTPVLRDRSGDDRYRLWCREGSVGAARVIAAAAGVALEASGDGGEAGWSLCTATIRGGAAGTSAMLTRLHAGGVEVARLERIAPTLADLIERVLSGASPRGTDA